ncbi:MAG: hypothetical protein JXX28_08395 [Deltaproteobacteria bacterium]|nr:hypothetical protein [Deltaproteobacteria bacterium]
MNLLCLLLACPTPPPAQREVPVYEDCDPTDPSAGLPEEEHPEDRDRDQPAEP